MRWSGIVVAVVHYSPAKASARRVAALVRLDSDHPAAAAAATTASTSTSARRP
jgi:hypothetical protein